MSLHDAVPIFWRLPTGTVLRASDGEGFTAPTLYQMFSEYGNVALTPEEAHGWEAGVEQQFLGRALTVGATWFDRLTAGQIIFNYCSPTPKLGRASCRERVCQYV